MSVSTFTLMEVLGIAVEDKEVVGVMVVVVVIVVIVTALTCVVVVVVLIIVVLPLGGSSVVPKQTILAFLTRRS